MSLSSLIPMEVDMLSLTISPGSKLGIWIEPAQVRLFPAVEDGYLWTATPREEILIYQTIE